MIRDFSALRRRIDEALAASLGELDGEAREALLRRRAAALASRPSEAAAREVVAEVVVVRRGALLLAAPLVMTREVRHVRVARLPMAGRVVVGLFQVRGRTDCLIDPAALLGDSDPVAHGAESLALVVTGAQGELGLRIDEVVGARTIHGDELASEAVAVSWVRNLTLDMVHIIDIDALLSCPEVRIGAGSGERS